jgi:hypothetical protein
MRGATCDVGQVPTADISGDYSITSSARSSIACENRSPSDFAVLRFMTVSKMVGR